MLVEIDDPYFTFPASDLTIEVLNLPRYLALRKNNQGKTALHKLHGTEMLYSKTKKNCLLKKNKKLQDKTVTMKTTPKKMTLFHIKSCFMPK